MSLTALATETVRDFVPRALDKRIDLGYEGAGRRDARQPLPRCAASRCCCAS